MELEKVSGMVDAIKTFGEDSGVTKYFNSAKTLAMKKPGLAAGFVGAGAVGTYGLHKIFGGGSNSNPEIVNNRNG